MKSLQLSIKSAYLLALIFPVLGGALLLPSPGAAASESAASWAWRDLTPATGQAPEARRNGMAIYDAAGKRIVIFGGVGQSGILNDAWAFDLDTSTWTRLETAGTAPAPRFGHDAVYDPVGRRVVVWAGQRGSEFFNDTWTLDLATLEWRDVSPASGRPRSRYGSASVFDPVDRQLVQFAGFTSEFRRFHDTQGFDLDTKTWQDHTPAGNKPGVRCLLTAAYDRAGRRMIIYGGQRGGHLDDLWAFDLNTRAWTELTPATRPAGRFFATSFIARDGNFYVFGGNTASGNVNELWSFNFQTGQWAQVEIAGAPSPRNGMMGAYVEEEDRFIVFGGTGSNLFNDVWELKNMAAADLSPEITGATMSGKTLVVTGKNFDDGAQIIVNDKPYKTKNDAQEPAARLTSKKAGKKIAPGQQVTLRVRNAGGAVSDEFSFTRPVQ